MGLRSFNSLEEAVKECFGEDVKITGRSYVGGGDINDAAGLSLSNGQQVFVKSNSVNNLSFFEAESAGLEAIASTKAIGTPKLLCMGCDRRAGISFLMMEMIGSGRPARDCWEVFGRDLAAMHRADTSAFVRDGRFGFVSDNFIGASKQINSCRDTWTDFFRQCRLEPQFKKAERYFDRDLAAKIIGFLDHLDEILIEPEYPSLLHGDLWSGNVMIGPDGRAMLIDPAVYVGHAEADIAMTELFGRRPESFYRSYRENGGMQQGYEKRKDIYNLYHLLNHLNLFGRSYLGSVVDIIKNGVY